MLRGHFGNGMEAVKKAFVQRRLGFGSEELFYHRFISLLGKALKLRAIAAESGTPHEMGHKGNVFSVGRGHPPLPRNVPFRLIPV